MASETQAQRLVGPNSAVLKYDLLTALLLIGFHGAPLAQVSATRLSLLLTARYNWKTDQVSIGQADLAKLWNVTPRTVKREVKRQIDAGWLIVIRAGVKGRVARYRLGQGAVFSESRAFWAEVGSDYVDRMEGLAGRAETKLIRVDFTAKDRDASDAPSAPQGDLDPLIEALRVSRPDLFETWFSQLKAAAPEGNVLTVHAPNSFIARYVETHFLNAIQAAVQDLYGHSVTVRFAV